jgi:hypothetical protein
MKWTPTHIQMVSKSTTFGATGEADKFKLLWIAYQEVKTRNPDSKRISEAWRNVTAH